MPIDYHRIRAWPFPETAQTYTDKDTMLYALGVGVGFDPLDPGALRYVYEHNLVTLPTQAAVLAYPGFWMSDPDTGIDWRKAVHGEQALHIHHPLPASATVFSQMRVTAVVDKGRDRGALIVTDRDIRDRDSGLLYATSRMTTFCRGDGGFGEGDPAPAALPAPPDTPPDQICDLPTLPQAALIYRLSADRNPLHVDPVAAQSAGFPRPILHGLCTFGIACHAIVKTVCNYDASRLQHLAARFSAPVYPGETIRTELWRRDHSVSFRCWALERDLVVLNHGVAGFHLV